MSASSKQIGGSHYKGRSIQPHVYSHSNGLGWHQGEIVKYVTRYKDKGGKEDLQKAIHVIELLMELDYPEQTCSENKTQKSPSMIEGLSRLKWFVFRTQTRVETALEPAYA